MLGVSAEARVDASVGGLEHAAAEVWAHAVNFGWSRNLNLGLLSSLHSSETGLDYVRLCQRFGFPYYSFLNLGITLRSLK